MNRIMLFLACLLFFACSEDDPATPGNFTIWDGPSITFEKQEGADATDPLNQDRINDDVWITRGNTGGQIFNARTESAADKDVSPAGTEWAVGTTANIENLTFAAFRATINPQDVVGQDLVLHLIDADVYLDVRFTSWSIGNGPGGGFAYERSTEN